MEGIEEKRKAAMTWLKRAMSDFAKITELIDCPVDELPTGTVCYYCKQFVKRSLKAFLSANGQYFDENYDCEILSYSCEQIDRDFSWVASKAENFEWYVKGGKEFRSPPLEETMECLDFVLKLKELVFKKLGVATINDLKVPKTPREKTLKV